MNFPSNDQCTFLLVTAIGGQAAIVKKPISLSRANVNTTPPRDGYSPLQTDARKGHTSVVEQLLPCQDQDTNA